MIRVMASSTAAREPGMTRIGVSPIRPPTARLRMQAGPISAKLSIRKSSPYPGSGFVSNAETVS